MSCYVRASSLASFIRMHCYGFGSGVRKIAPRRSVPTIRRTRRRSTCGLTGVCRLEPDTGVLVV